MGTRVELSPGVRRYGALLVGGAPARAVRLGAGGVALLADGGFALDGSTARATFAEQLVDAGLATYLPTGDPLPDRGGLVVVVPAFGRAEGVDRLLRALGGLHPVVLVDDHSPDPVALRDVAALHDAELLRLPANLGPAGARNAGLLRARERGAAFVLFADSDVVVAPADVERLRGAFADPRVAAAAPRVAALVEDGSVLARYEAAASSLDRGPVSAWVAPGGPVAYVPSAVVLARVDALGDGFDATLEVGEDVDLVWRLHRGGWRVRYDAGARAYHDHRTAPVAWARRKSDYGESTAALARRHGDLAAPAVLAPLGVAQLAAAVWQRPLGGAVAAGIAAVVGHRLAGRLGGGGEARRAAAALVGRGTRMNCEQLTWSLLRHHWPLAVAGALASRRVRRLVVVAVLVDTATGWVRQRPDLDPVTYAVLRRADDLAYGYGLWRGAIRARSGRALLPAWRWA
ncbi:mycofactocin biosynthesis glycosyltransferase MftF [Nocardioides sp. CPCC 205120]|uniref:mycofactocin biosynthesis glycosyltransferase MftF n=1 Tax=Nocardioides sp. CPCC 205120 TaxID=3406462 RepID=UPI003B514E53